MQGRDDGGRAATKAAIVDPGNARSVVGEFRLDFGVCDEGRGFRLNGDLGLGVIMIKVMVMAIRGSRNSEGKIGAEESRNIVTEKHDNLLRHDLQE